MFDETRTTGQLTAQDLSPQEPNDRKLPAVNPCSGVLEACTRGRRMKCYPAAILVGDVIRARLSPKRF